MQRNENVRTYGKYAGKRVGLVVARFNGDITSRLLEDALEALRQSGIKEKDITVVSVPGAAEIPFVLQQMARKKKYHALAALACIVRGDTPHFDYVCKIAVEGLLEVQLDFDVPIGMGILTLNNLKQAKQRYHVGGDAVLAALELANLKL